MDKRTGQLARRRARASRAVLTIVSGNYLPRARALCRSLEEHEPSVRRFVVIVDRPVSHVVGKDEPFEAIPVEDLDIPNFEGFMAQYTVIEANTAVKPYALLYLLARHEIDHLVYLDPDILVLRPLAEVWKALANASIVLTPHLREPFRDNEHPTELGILRSGTYNLGFLAVRRTAEVTSLLEWWAEKCEHDCVVDTEGGLFVDQKWMDLVPGYLDGVSVLRDPGYNVAYWNLHEREISFHDGGGFANGSPLVFFHFSGYDPDRPWTLSKHQSRHHLASLPDVKELCDTYAGMVRAEERTPSSSHAYGFSTLQNGVPISPVIRRAVRHFRKAGIPFPSLHDADEFCRFLMTPNVAVSGAEISPFVHHLLGYRPDVAAAFPNARKNAADPGLMHWLERNGDEVEAGLLVKRFRSILSRPNPFTLISDLFDRRHDVRDVYPDAFETLQGLERFAAWLRMNGVSEVGFTEAEVDEFIESGKVGFARVLEFFCVSPDLHPHFPLALLPCGRDFVEWLIQNAGQANLTICEILWFERRLRSVDPNLLVLLTALRNEWVRKAFPLAATRFGWREFCTWVHGEASRRGHTLAPTARTLPRHIPISLQLESLQAAENPPSVSSESCDLRMFAENTVDNLRPPLTSVERQEVNDLFRQPRQRGVNVAGYLHYAAGVGTSAHSLIRTLDAAGIAHHDISLPVRSAMVSAEGDPTCIPLRFWQQHRADFPVSITVANADAVRAARAFLGPRYSGNRRHIGYWVWETDRLPGKYAKAVDGFSEIWTPSEYSARALRRTLGDRAAVHVVPHTVVASTSRSPAPLPFALPDARAVIGFFFDARSVVARKNPAAVLRAFRCAFRDDDSVSLVLKVNHAAHAPATMRELYRLSEGLPVTWIRDVQLTESQVYSLLQRLDIYASLHRAEGFGLVLAEAMALGKPVIATRFSGNLEFMTDTTACLVHCEEVATDRAHGPYPRGTRWAEPNIEHAAHLLRTLAFDRGLRREIGNEAKRHIERTLSPGIVAKTLLERLGWQSTEAELMTPGGGSPSRVLSRAARPPEERVVSLTKIS